MKKIILLVFAIATTMGGVFANDDTPISLSQLPNTAQQFIKKYFTKLEVAYVTEDKEFMGSEYKVVFKEGTTIEFDNKGVWSEVECRSMSVPEGVTPTSISKLIKEKHPNQKIMSIDRRKSGYDVELDNSVDMKFDLNGKFIGYDH